MLYSHTWLAEAHTLSLDALHEWARLSFAALASAPLLPVVANPLLAQCWSDSPPHTQDRSLQLLALRVAAPGNGKVIVNVVYRDVLAVGEARGAV